MKTSLAVVALITLLFYLLPATTLAQSGAFLPLQPKKLAYAKEVEQESIDKNDTLLRAEAYYLYGKVYTAARDYLTAKRYFMKSLRIVEQHQIPDKIARIYLRLSEMELDQSNTRKALEYAHLSLAYKKPGPRRQLIAAYAALGITYHAICQDSLIKNRRHPLQDSMFYYCHLSLQMAIEYKDSLTQGSVNITLGNIYRLRKNPKAFQHYQNALILYTHLNHKLNQAKMLQLLALTHLIFHQPDKAYPLLKESEAVYQSLHIREFGTEKDLAETYLSYYQQKKNWKKAFDESQLARRYDHDQMIADRDGAVSRLSVEYDTEKKEVTLKSQQRELALSQQNQRIQSRFLIALSTLLTGALIASLTFYRLSRKNQRLSIHNAALVQEQNHRVKNNLQFVSSLLSLQSSRLMDESAKHAVEDSQRRIEVMSLLQRKLYDGDNLIAIPLSEFMQELTDMILEAFQAEHVIVNYQIQPTLSLSADHAMRIGLIINELITNACKYAFPDNPTPKLWLQASIEAETFYMSIADNGKGLPIAPPSSKSFGMRLIQMQVEQLYGTYSFDSWPGTRFQMSFTLLPATLSKTQLSILQTRQHYEKT